VAWVIKSNFLQPSARTTSLKTFLQSPTEMENELKHMMT